MGGIANIHTFYYNFPNIFYIVFHCRSLEKKRTCLSSHQFYTKVTGQNPVKGRFQYLQGNDCPILPNIHWENLYNISFRPLSNHKTDLQILYECRRLHNLRRGAGKKNASTLNMFCVVLQRFFNMGIVDWLSCFLTAYQPFVCHLK